MSWWRRPGRRGRAAGGIDLGPRVPVRLVEWELGEQETIVLLVPRFRRGPLARLLQPRLPPERRHVRVRLDPLGSWVWRACDGLRNVASIARGFGAQFPDQDDPGQRVALFVWNLHRNDFVALRSGGEDTGQEALLSPARGPAAGSAGA